MTSETVIETAEVDISEDSEGLDFIDESESDNAPESKEDFWAAFEDEKAESLTTVWVCDASFDVADQGSARDIFASTTKEKVVNRLFAIISSPDLKEPCDFDAASFTTKQQAIRAFFDGAEGRNLFIGLVPVF